MGEVDTAEYYAEKAAKIISPGYVSGGLAKLRETYPDNYRNLEERLETNFSREGRVLEGE